MSFVVSFFFAGFFLSLQTAEMNNNGIRLSRGNLNYKFPIIAFLLITLKQERSRYVNHFLRWFLYACLCVRVWVCVFIIIFFFCILSCIIPIFPVCFFFLAFFAWYIHFHCIINGHLLEFFCSFFFVESIKITSMNSDNINNGIGKMPQLLFGLLCLKTKWKKHANFACVAFFVSVSIAIHWLWLV